jgi:hypothetical protein
MSTCLAKRGIFTLRECGQDASDTCSACGKPLCQEHVVYLSAKVFCAQCQAKEPDFLQKDDSQKPKRALQIGPVPEDEPLEDDWRRPGWAMRWRDGYYRSTRYAPFRFGIWSGGYYDDYDLRSFDAIDDGPMQDGDDEAAGFSDS